MIRIHSKENQMMVELNQNLSLRRLTTLISKGTLALFRNLELNLSVRRVPQAKCSKVATAKTTHSTA
jgi:hypothetical protein